MVELAPEGLHSIAPAKVPEHKAMSKKNPVTVAEVFGDATTVTSTVDVDKHSLEAIKAKRLEKKPAPRLWKEKAEFLPETAKFLRACGVNPDDVNPVPIGQGFTHIVFSYLPDGERPKVIKIPRAASNNLMTQGFEEDKENTELVKKYFGEYSVLTELRKDPETGKYLYIQDQVNGKPVTHLNETQSVRTQLADLARLNREMMRQTGHSLDFIGVPGGFSLLRHQVRHLFTAKSEFEVSNILIDENGKLKIIDDTLLRFRDVPLKQRSVSELGFLSNRLVMRLYFGVDLRPKLEDIAPAKL